MDADQQALAVHMVRGARKGDRVQLHGAVVAAFDLYADGVVRGRVFKAALELAEASHGAACREAVAHAIRDQVAYRRQQG